MENKDLERILNKWFEMIYQTYDRLEHDESIYYYYVGKEYAEIRIDKKDTYIYYIWKLYEEFSEIIPLEDIEFEMVMSKWVGDTFGLKRFIPKAIFASLPVRLEIPKINN